MKATVYCENGLSNNHGLFVKFVWLCDFNVQCAFLGIYPMGRDVENHVILLNQALLDTKLYVLFVIEKHENV